MNKINVNIYLLIFLQFLKNKGVLEDWINHCNEEKLSAATKKPAHLFISTFQWGSSRISINRCILIHEEWGNFHSKLERINIDYYSTILVVDSKYKLLKLVNNETLGGD